MEIERKWLTKGWPDGLEQIAEFKMRQGYINLRPTVRIREEAGPEGTDYVLCFKSKASADGLAREEIETCVEKELFERLEQFIGMPLIAKVQRRYALPGGLVLEVNQVDAGKPGEFWYSEIEFPSREMARDWQPGELSAFLEREVTNVPGQTMGSYWVRTRGEMK